MNSHLLSLFILYRSSGEKMIKYQANSSFVILSLILITTLFYKALILQGEIRCWSLSWLKGLTLTKITIIKPQRFALIFISLMFLFLFSIFSFICFGQRDLYKPKPWKLSKLKTSCPRFTCLDAMTTCS